jgi:hypothetical protein
LHKWEGTLSLIKPIVLNKKGKAGDLKVVTFLRMGIIRGDIPNSLKGTI